MEIIEQFQKTINVPLTDKVKKALIEDNFYPGKLFEVIRSKYRKFVRNRTPRQISLTNHIDVYTNR